LHFLLIHCGSPRNAKGSETSPNLRGWKLCRGAAPLYRGDCCAPHTPGLTRPCLIQPCVVGGSGVAVAPRHIRRRLECLWRRPGGHAAHIARRSISSPCSDVAHLAGRRDDSTQHGVFCWFLAPTQIPRRGSLRRFIATCSGQCISHGFDLPLCRAVLLVGAANIHGRPTHQAPRCWLQLSGTGEGGAWGGIGGRAGCHPSIEAGGRHRGRCRCRRHKGERRRPCCRSCIHWLLGRGARGPAVTPAAAGSGGEVPAACCHLLSRWRQL
jgi:hypothetical protein